MKNNINFYYVFDKISKCPVTNLIPANNDVVALRGFIDYLKPADGKPTISPEELCLIRAFTTDEDFNVINNNKITLCSGDKADDVCKDIIANTLKEE